MWTFLAAEDGNDIDAAVSHGCLKIITPRQEFNTKIELITELTVSTVFWYVFIIIKCTQIFIIKIMSTIRIFVICNMFIALKILISYFQS